MKTNIKLNATLILSLMLIFFAACGDDNPQSPTPEVTEAQKYMAKDVAKFTQKGTDKTGGKEVAIPDSTMELERTLISIEGNKYSYEIKGNKVQNEHFLVEEKRIFQYFYLPLEDMEVVEYPVPILDLNLTGTQEYKDTIIKMKADLGPIMQQDMSVIINLDVNFKSELIANGTKTVKLNGNDISVVSYTSKNTFTVKINDPLIALTLPQYNNKLIGSGSYENENYFTAKDNLGIIWQNKIYKIYDEISEPGSSKEQLYQEITRRLNSLTLKEN
jgi:hypothetical protein